MTLGLIARADDGGLGAMTWEAARHLQPARTLVVLTDHHTRGRADPSRFEGQVRTCCRLPDRTDVAWLLDGITTLYTAETWYGRSVLDAARARGVRTVLHAMPEMGGEDADLILAPTPWRLDLIPTARVLPVPVARDRFTYRRRDGVTTLFHVGSNAFHDRNGTELLLAAAAKMRRPCRLLIRNPQDRKGIGFHGAVTVEWIGHHRGPYFDWPDVDVLVLPRRFAGLCLPMQEAAAQGIPTVSLDVAPQNAWLPAEALIPAEVVTPAAHMKGGSFDVHGCRPSALAQRLDHLIDHPELVATLSDEADRWAASISWAALLDEYRQVLTPVVV